MRNLRASSPTRRDHVKRENAGILSCGVRDDTPRGAGGPPADHAEPLSSVESLARHEIDVAGFDNTQKIRVCGGTPCPSRLPAWRCGEQHDIMLQKSMRRRGEGGGGGHVLPGPLSSACPRSRRRKSRGGLETPHTNATQGGPGRTCPPPPPAKPPQSSYPLRGSREIRWAGAAWRAGVGGVPSLDPYLLRVLEAEDESLVAGQRLHTRMRLRVVQGGNAPHPRP